MHSIVVAINVIACLVIVIRAIYIGSASSLDTWNDHPLKFVLLTLSYPFLVGGAVGLLFGRDIGYSFLLVGVTFHLLAERRRTR